MAATSTTAGIRLSQSRLAATGDDNGGRPVHQLYKPGTDGDNLPATEGAAEFGDAFPVEGVDLITALVNLAQVAGTTVRVVAQCSPKAVPGDDWFDVYMPDGSGSVQRFLAAVAVSGSAKLALPVPVSGRWMRLKIWADGSTTDRATIRVIRNQGGAAN